MIHVIAIGIMGQGRMAYTQGSGIWTVHSTIEIRSLIPQHVASHCDGLLDKLAGSQRSCVPFTVSTLINDDVFSTHQVAPRMGNIPAHILSDVPCT
jgi:hypothetical protein